MRSIAVSSRRWTGKSKADGRPTSRKKQSHGDNYPKPAEVVLLVGAHGSPALGLQGLLRCAAITSPCMPRGLVISATRASRPWRWRAVPWPWGPEPGPDRLRAPPARLGTGRCPRGAPARPVAGWAGAEAWALAAPTGVRASRSSRGSRGSDGEVSARVAKAEDPGHHVHHSAWDAPRSPRSQAPGGWERDCCLEIRSEPASAGPSDSGGVRRISSQQNSMQK